jgi:hypothetical protein
MWLRFVEGRPISAITIQFLEWCCEKPGRMNKQDLIFVWDNARWHISRAVQQWIRAHNRAWSKTGVQREAPWGLRRIVRCI